MNMISKLILVILTIENFPTAIFDRLGLLHGDAIYKIRKNKMKFLARTGTEDLAEIAVVVSGSEYNLNTVSLPKKPLIVDLGGHIGSFSIPMAKLYNDKCKIYTFEPDEENYRILKKNIALNKLNSIVASKLAISDYAGKGYLKTENLNTDAYYLESSRKKSNCLVSTLPIELEKHKIKFVDLLKMDIEGAEYDIFKHKKSMDFILKYVNYIFIEIGPSYNLSKMKKIIDENFLTIHRQKNVLTLKNPNWNS